MSQMIDGPRKTFLAGETGGAYIRWYVSDASTSPPTVMIAGASQPSIGASEAAVLTTGPVALLLANASGTRKLLANGVITGGNNAYAAADGEVASSGTILEGTALETTTADGDILEVMGTFGEDIDSDWADDELLELGTGNDAILMWSTGDTDNHSMVVGLGDTNEALHITDKAARATDWDVAADTHPTVYVHSNTTPATDYLKVGAHNGTSCWIGDVVGGPTAFIGFDGLEVLEFTETATAVNHLGIVNAATGNNPIVRAEGESDTGITFDNEAGEEILILNSIATSVNEITISSAATGNNPLIACTGEADTGITFQNLGGEEILILNSVASSVNELTIHSAATGNKPIIAATGEADNGIEFHNDQAEEILILAAVATAVNEITITNAATAAGPIIGATGETNVDINLTPNGTGDVNLTTGHVIMGDGATATQGTNKSTTTVCTGESGQITMHNATLNDDTAVAFTVTNTRVGATDVVIANLASVNTASAYTLTVDAVASGSFNLSLRNHSGGALGEAVVINFAVIGGSAT